MQALILLCVVAAAVAGLEQTCLEEADGGMCRGYFPAYYYDPKTQTCKEFIYGGCMGNGNRYATQEDCEKNCDGVVVWDSVESDCNLAPESGVCDAYFKRYYFDRKSGLCQQFVYGGCGGNENNFKSKYECEDKCKRTADRAICELEKVVGPCRAAFRKFFFNKETGKCEKFFYGGCHGNGNNFANQGDCEAVCVA